MFLKGEKVNIRSLQRDDLPKIVSWKNDPVIADLVRGAPINTNLDIELRRFEQNIDEYDILRLIIETLKGKQIGFITISEIDKINKKAEVGMLIGEKNYWGQGYGSDALVTLLDYLFYKLDFNRIGLEVFSYNERAINLYKKIGFKEEGIEREGLIKNGKKYDIFHMGLLKSEFIELHNK